MRRFWLILAAISPFVAFAAYANHAHLHGKAFSWSASFAAGGLDPNSVFVGGTEGRAFAVYKGGTKNAVLYWGNGYWEDTPGGEGAQSGQVLALTSPLSQGGKWTQSLNMGGAGNCPSDNLNCALAVSALASLPWVYDSANNPVNVTTIVAASWFQGASDLVGGCPNLTPMYNWTLNNTDGLWYQDMVSCEASSDVGTAQLRSYGIHVDQVLSQTENAFVGGAPSGIWRGVLSNARGAGHHLIIWSGALCPNNTVQGGSGCEWSSTNYPTSFPTCTHQIRVMAFAEATGSDSVTREYMSACFGVFVRIDGPQNNCFSDQVDAGFGVCRQRWQPYWQSPDGATATSESGLRGLTAIQSASTLITGAEGSGPQAIYNIPPLPGCATLNGGTVVITNPSCASVESSTLDTTNEATGMHTGATVSPYNNFPLVFDALGVGHRYAPQASYITAGTTAAPANSGWTFEALGGTGSGKKWAEAMFAARTALGGLNYNLTVLPHLFSTPMNGVRDIAVSPWPTECVGGNWPNACALYFTGYDADGASFYYWCQTTPCPASPPFVPTHNTAWIARWGP